MRNRLALLFLLLPLLVCLCALLLWPLCVLLFESLHGGESSMQPTLTQYLRIVSDPFYREALLHSLGLSAMAAAASTLLSLGPAWLLAQHEFRGKRLMRAGFTLPISLSGIMIGFFAVVMLGRVGFVPQLSEKLTGEAWLSGAAYQMTGLVIAYLYFEVPRSVLALESALRRFNPQLDQAAQTLGASRWQRLRWVILPMLWPALISGFALTFGVSLGSFGVALILSRRFSVLPLELFHELVAMSNGPLACAMAVTLAVMALASHAVLQWATPRKS
jgi:putative spermidine/putrescine transport system permease protein